MKSAITAAVLALSLAVPAAAQTIRVVHPGQPGPVVIVGGTVISGGEPRDMNLTPINGSAYAFRNQAGQVVINVPAGRTARVIKN